MRRTLALLAVITGLIFAAGQSFGQMTLTGAGASKIGSVAWTPASLPGLVAWYKADAGVYSDAGTTLATNGQTAQQWNDQSGNGYNLSQGTSGERPTYLAAGFNGGKTVQFAAVSTTGLSVGSVALGAGAFGSAFIVGQMLTGTVTNGQVITYNEGAVNDYASPGSALWLARNGSGNSVFAYRNFSTLDGESISLATNYRIGSIFDGTNQTTYINNVAGTPAASAYSWATPGTIAIGRGVSAPSSAWDGPISEVVITNSALSSTDRNNLDTYFKAKWGL